MHLNELKAGLIGVGTVGRSVVNLWPRTGGIILKKIADKNKNVVKDIRLKGGIFTTRAEDILNDPEIDIVIELIGGIGKAYDYIRNALERGKNVVTANKALLALKGEELEGIARERGVSLSYEASVCAGVPIIRAIRDGMVVNRIRSIYGIINGTANFVLSSMEEKGISFAQALSQAQARGFAERDASLDIDGFDSQHKLTILVRLAFKTSVRLSDIYVEGIRHITSRDITYASELGYGIKLLAIAKNEGRRIEARVHPTLIPRESLLSSVRGIHNACFVEGDACGKMVFYGQGAGGMPTASAILSDVKEIASAVNIRKYVYQFRHIKSTIQPIENIDNLSTRYYIRFSTLDRPGVLARICAVLGRYGISIASVIQKERSGVRSVPVVMMTHEARERNIRKAISSIDKLDVITEKSLFIRVEDFED